MGGCPWRIDRPHNPRAGLGQGRDPGRAKTVLPVLSRSDRLWAQESPQPRRSPFPVQAARPGKGHSAGRDGVRSGAAPSDATEEDEDRRGQQQSRQRLGPLAPRGGLSDGPSERHVLPGMSAGMLQGDRGRRSGLYDLRARARVARHPRVRSFFT